MHRCSNCGFEPERQSKFEAVDGELIALTGGKKPRKLDETHPPQMVYGMLIAVQRERG